MQKSRESKKIGGVLFLVVLFLSLAVVAAQSIITLWGELGPGGGGSVKIKPAEEGGAEGAICGLLESVKWMK